MFVSRALSRDTRSAVRLRGNYNAIGPSEDQLRLLRTQTLTDCTALHKYYFTTAIIPFNLIKTGK